MTPVTLRVDPQGFFLYWTDQNKVKVFTSSYAVTQNNENDLFMCRAVADPSCQTPERIKKHQASVAVTQNREHDTHLIRRKHLILVMDVNLLRSSRRE